jgi:L-asparagine transporter-like permease
MAAISIGRCNTLVRSQRIPVRYVLLAVSAGLTSVILVLESSQQIFRLEAAVVGLQFAILIYSIIVDRQPVLRLLLRHSRGK